MFIYKITNKINGKVYIGQTHTSLKVRLTRHLSDVKKGSKLAIHNAIRKYGMDNFLIEEIDGANSGDNLTYKEEFYIHKFKTLYPYGYNLILPQSHKLCEKSKKQISKTIKNIVTKEQLTRMTELSKESCQSKVKAKNILTGEIIIFNSLKDCKKIGANSKYLSAMLSGKKNYKDYCGYYFEYLDKLTVKKAWDINPQIKKIKRIDKETGEEKVYTTLSSVKYDGFAVSSVSQYANKKVPNYTKYHWEYV